MTVRAADPPGSAQLAEKIEEVVGDVLAERLVIGAAKRLADIVSSATSLASPDFTNFSGRTIFSGRALLGFVHTQPLHPLPPLQCLAQVLVLVNGRKKPPLKVGQPTRQLGSCPHTKPNATNFVPFL